MNATKLFGMRDALAEQLELSSYDSLSFEKRIGMFADREWIDRENRKLERRMKAAKPKIQASVEDIDYWASRGSPFLSNTIPCWRTQALIWFCSLVVLSSGRSAERLS